MPNLTIPKSAIDLGLYQKTWIENRQRYKIGMFARQTGKSFSTALEIALDMHERSNTLWILLSAGERQSKELMGKLQMHTRAFNIAAAFDQNEFRGADGTTYKQLEMILNNDSRAIALPANPDTARGHSGNVFLDEFAIHKNSYEIWSALFPTITRGYRIRITSTPKGRKNKFYQIWSSNPKFYRQQVTIFDAVAQGLMLRDEEGRIIDPEELRLALDDDEAWQQEYLLEFLDEATAFLTYDLISEADHPLIHLDEAFTFGPVYMGVDIGRTRDLTVIAILELLGDVYWTRRLHTLEKTKFRQQYDTIAQYIANLNPVRVCVDQTGIGMQLAEDLTTDFGIYRVEGITFSLPVKEDIATTVLRTFQDGKIRIPIDNVLREDLHSVRKVTTTAGHTRFDAERTKDGHADRFWALGLALHAGISPGAYVPDIVSSSRRESYATTRGFSQFSTSWRGWS